MEVRAHHPGTAANGAAQQRLDLMAFSTGARWNRGTIAQRRRKPRVLAVEIGGARYCEHRQD
jgi:hypothetical protein